MKCPLPTNLVKTPFEYSAHAAEAYFYEDINNNYPQALLSAIQILLQTCTLEDVVSSLKGSLTRTGTSLHEVKNCDKWTALHFACFYGDERSIEIMLQATGNKELAWTLINQPADGNVTALNLATNNRNKAIVGLLKSYHP